MNIWTTTFTCMECRAWVRGSYELAIVWCQEHSLGAHGAAPIMFIPHGACLIPVDGNLGELFEMYRSPAFEKETETP